MARRFMETKNLNGAMSILCALTNSAIGRMKRTFAEVRFQRLLDETSPSVEMEIDPFSLIFFSPAGQGKIR